ncbi:LAGLIDADG family homing endonuclease [Varunaivibrio sulfuroxidans]|uniref:Ribonucleoside-diphosphate reductase n=1 Tax=Varunaivibrio sulfuroxidans TaxID=1773489 RepID=A0A4R3JC35_9PROT|nr:LAGLIDADG family homing endonuclease [Varunaivibrio sulfuroxidans]TCS63518.1 ribonucleoside-diphosphate reductase alpha chain [Varunaivibrio sulfuroxidans]WES30337.1 LAGLIDADG family homing endonuclease [Varunaivibrio sulfuroxidans]
MAQMASISHQIWDMKYRLKDADGHPVDKGVADTWRRIAKAVAASERNPGDWEDRFYRAMEDFRFLPAGRIVAGAGAGRQVTLFNCFVMGDIPDDMGGIFDALKDAALTMQQGGGIGYDFSTLRPKGARVGGVGADASGPLPFMDVWDSMCRTIMSAGSRRGAMMGVLRCDHPDIEDFIDAKCAPGRMRMFNLSVLVSDDFVRAVKENAPWDLVFDGVVYRTVKARDLWDKVMRATYAYAEPGVIFIDRINRANNLWYCETIHATNPCVTADTWVQTDQGPRQVAQLHGGPFRAIVDGRPYESAKQGFFSTGVKNILRLTTKEGHALRLTANHPVRKVVRKTRHTLDSDWVPAGNLAPGDEIVLHDHRSYGTWGGRGSEQEGYLLGLLVGDGALKQDKAVLSVWLARSVVNGGNGAAGAHGVMDAALAAALTLPHRADFRGWTEVKGRDEFRMSPGALKTLAHDMGMAPGARNVTPEIERTSSDFYCGFLRGFFDADGSVQGAQKKGVSVRLAQSDLERLRAVQRMLLRLGVNSTIYQDRRPAGKRSLPDGRGGRREYECAANHELVISGANLEGFAERIGFADIDKMLRLKSALSGYKRVLNRERFIATVDVLVADGSEEVFDVQIPGANAFDANGLYVHNCGEQPLPPYGACLLGSINLAKMVGDPFTDDAALDVVALRAVVGDAVRFLDDVIDVSNFPLPQQRHEALSKRRIGLGVTGLADALILCGARYGSARGVALCETWFREIERAAYFASVEIAKEKGPFPLFDREKYLRGEKIKGLDADLRAAIAEHGIRNSHLTSVAPTGTISLYADNVSSGLEPVFSFKYSRNVLQPDGARRAEDVVDYAYRQFHRIKGEDAPLTEAFVDAMDLSPKDHLVMQAAAQRFVDSSISKTINVPEDIPFDSFKDIYMQAFDAGCKGCTTYRPNTVTGAVLEVKKERKKPAPVEPELPFATPGMATTNIRPKDIGDSGAVARLFRPLDRPDALPGETYKVHWPESDHAIYITLNDLIDENGRRRPFEVFINSKNMEHYAWTVALTRMISAVFRRGGDVSFVVEELKAVFDPRGGQWVKGKYVPSLLAAIGDIIEQHMIATGFLHASWSGGGGQNPEPETPPQSANNPGDVEGKGGARFKTCPKCAQPGFIHQEGCDSCLSCGYSKCG